MFDRKAYIFHLGMRRDQHVHSKESDLLSMMHSRRLDPVEVQDIDWSRMQLLAGNLKVNYESLTGKTNSVLRKFSATFFKSKQ